MPAGRAWQPTGPISASLAHARTRRTGGLADTQASDRRQAGSSHTKYGGHQVPAAGGGLRLRGAVPVQQNTREHAAGALHRASPNLMGWPVIGESITERLVFSVISFYSVLAIERDFAA